MNKSKDSSYKQYLNCLGKQYEEYPYPERNAEDEKKRLLATMGDMLGHINHYCFEGKRDFTKGFRVLVAGAGTGDSLIFLAEQLRDSDAEIVYLDLSRASMDVAKERAKVRRLDNIQWEYGSLLDLHPSKIGVFDYINCSGVLHHLDEPSQGLARLNSVLKDDGAMLIMLYAEYGRAAIYQVQELMRLINFDESDMAVKMKNCKSILDSLPESHLINIMAVNGTDYKKFDEIELYDLFLIGTDRAYTVPQLYDFVEAEGLVVGHFYSHQPHYGSGLYKPETYIKDSKLLHKAKEYSTGKQRAIAELMNGRIPKHTFYITKTRSTSPEIDQLNCVPYLNPFFSKQAYKDLFGFVKKSGDEVRLRTVMNIEVNFRKTQHTDEIFQHLDGERKLKDIFKRVMASPKCRKSKVNFVILLEEFKIIYDEFESYSLMMLRDSSVPYPKSIEEMQDYLK